MEKNHHFNLVEVIGRNWYYNNKKYIFREGELFQEKTKIIIFSVVFTLTFCFAAFASEKKIPATENFTNDVVYDNPRNLEMQMQNNLAAFLPQIENFKLKSVRVYPVYQKPGDTEDYYDSNIYKT